MKKKILLIDDSPFILRVLGETLKDEFLIQTAGSAEDAIDVLKEAQLSSPSCAATFNLIITDLNMPGLSGYDVAKFIKGQNREKAFTPVIMLTEMNITKEEARRHGCAAYIPKSNLQKVVSMARILLQGSD